VGADVAEAMHPGDEPILVGRALLRAVDRRVTRRDRVGVDDLEEAAVRYDRELVGFEDRQERLVRLGDPDLLGRVDARLDVLDLAAEDEALSRELRDDANELAEVSVLERERHLVVRVPRLELETALELREAGRVRLGLAARGAAGRGRGWRRTR